MIGFGQLSVHQDSLRNSDGSIYWKPDSEKKYNGILFTGIAFRLDEKGAIIYECSYKDGIKHGLEREWWYGNIGFRSYINGKETGGVSRIYNRNGWQDKYYEDGIIIESHSYNFDGNMQIHVNRCTDEGDYVSALGTRVVIDKFGYNGNCVQGDCFNGLGRKIYDNGMIYTGEFRNGSRSGLGLLNTNDGDIYGKWYGDYSVDQCDSEYPLKN